MKKLKIETKEEALAYLEGISQDFQLLRDGEWVPDEDSCNASIEVAEALIKWALKQ